MVMSDISARPAEMRLTERAADYLAAGPADVVALIGHICQLPNPPRVVAEHMATALFAGRTEFVREASGQWALSRSSEPAPRARAPVSPAAAADAARVSTRNADIRVSPASAPARVASLRMIDPLEAAPRVPGIEEPAGIAGDAARLDAVGSITPCDAADMLASLSYVVVDVETTGTRPWTGDRITEIAAVVVRD